MPPAVVATKDPTVPIIHDPMKPDESTVPAASQQEYGWLNHVKELLGKDNLEKEDCRSWAAYHASRQPTTSESAWIFALLPLVHSVVMVKHGIAVLKTVIEYLSPSQIPVVAMNQPLYALANQV